MAYILGFVMADGYIVHPEYCISGGYYLRFDLQQSDIQVLEFIKNELGVTSSISNRTRTKSIGKYTSITHESTLSIHSKELVLSLMELGVIPKKTGKEVFSNIPKEYERDFFRGLFDGDGCVSQSSYKVKNGIKNRLSFKISSASLNLLNSCKDKFNIGNIYKHSDKCFVLQTGDQKEIDRIKKVLYYDNSFCLKRKREKFNV